MTAREKMLERKLGGLEERLGLVEQFLEFKFSETFRNFSFRNNRSGGGGGGGDDKGRGGRPDKPDPHDDDHDDDDDDDYLSRSKKTTPTRNNRKMGTRGKASSPAPSPMDVERSADDAENVPGLRRSSRGNKSTPKMMPSEDDDDLDSSSDEEKGDNNDVDDEDSDFSYPQSHADDDADDDGESSDDNFDAEGECGDDGDGRGDDDSGAGEAKDLSRDFDPVIPSVSSRKRKQPSKAKGPRSASKPKKKRGVEDPSNTTKGPKHQQHQCPICGKGSSSQDGVVRHWQREHRGATMSCPKCDFTASSASTYYNHEKEHTFRDFLKAVQGESDNVKLRCTFCSESGSLDKMLTHLKKKHLTQMGMNSFRCKQCSYVGERAEQLNGHCRRQHGTTSSGSPVPREKRWKCDQCPADFYEKGNLMSHLKKLHSNDARRQLIKCKFCTTKDSNMALLQAHMRKEHPEEFTFTCNSCDRVFPNNKYLLAHQRAVHSNPAECERCGRSFKSAKGKTRHRCTALPDSEAEEASTSRRPDQPDPHDDDDDHLSRSKKTRPTRNSSSSSSSRPMGTRGKASSPVPSPIIKVERSADDAEKVVGLRRSLRRHNPTPKVMSSDDDDGEGEEVKEEDLEADAAGNSSDEEKGNNDVDNEDSYFTYPPSKTDDDGGYSDDNFEEEGGCGDDDGDDRDDDEWGEGETKDASSDFEPVITSVRSLQPKVSKPTNNKRSRAAAAAGGPRKNIQNVFNRVVN